MKWQRLGLKERQWSWRPQNRMPRFPLWSLNCEMPWQVDVPLSGSSMSREQHAPEDRIPLPPPLDFCVSALNPFSPICSAKQYFPSPKHFWDHCPYFCLLSLNAFILYVIEPNLKYLCSYAVQFVLMFLVFCVNFFSQLLLQSTYIHVWQFLIVSKDAREPWGMRRGCLTLHDKST